MAVHSDAGSGPSAVDSFLATASATTGGAALPGSLQAPTTSVNGVPPIKRVSGDTVTVPGTGRGDPTVGHVFSDQTGQVNTTSVPPPDMSLYDYKVDLLQQALTNPSAFLSLQQQLIDAGFLDPRSRSYHPGQVSVDDATYKAAVLAAQTAIAQKTAIPDLLSTRAAQDLGAKNMLTTKTTTASQTDLSNIGTVQSLLTDSMARLLGRKPTPNELQQAYATINQAQRDNPTLQSTTATTESTYDNGQLVNADTKNSVGTQSGGIDPGQAVDNLVENQHKGEAATHSLHGYVKSFESLLGGG